VPGIVGRAGGVLAGLRPGIGPGDLARAAFEGVGCAALDSLDQAADAGAAWDDRAPIRLAGPPEVLDVHAQVLASLADQPVAVAGGSLAAAGACAQAAAVLAGEPPAAVAQRWDLTGHRVVDPQPTPDRIARRLANAEERTRQRRALLS
jgi:sugar (pentulose or hexulose) kinase